MEHRLPWYERLKHERERRGWSLEDLAGKIGTDPKTVSRWEKNKTFPYPVHRQKLSQVFGETIEELRLIKEMVRKSEMEPTQALGQNVSSAIERVLAPIDGEPGEAVGRKEDWGDAPHLGNFYGREEELAELQRWIVDERCQVVALLGIGGVGKTTLARMAAQQLRDSFEMIFWRSLQHAPQVETILKSCIQFLSGGYEIDLLQDVDAQLSALMHSLREQRCLLVLDNVESVLLPGQRAGQYKERYAGYGRLIQLLGEAKHHSCLLLTSREKPRGGAWVQGNTSPVRTLALSGVRYADGRELLKDQGLVGSDEDWDALIRLYVGNPLALKIVSELVREVFGGDIASFLKEKQIVLGDIFDLLDQQFHRLTEQEQGIMYWLAIEREAVSLEDLEADIVQSLSKRTLLEALNSLKQRSLIEISESRRFTLQPAVMEYVTERFVRQVTEEIHTEAVNLFGSHALLKAQAKEYIRDSQLQLILRPVIERLLTRIGQKECERKLKQLLPLLHEAPIYRPGYAAGNMLNLLIELRADLRGYDFSHLAVRQAYLQGIALPEVNFAYADLETSVFTETFGGILAMAFSPDGAFVGAGTTSGEIRLWQVEGWMPWHTCRGHTEGVRSIAFNAEGTILASASEDYTVRLWDVRTGHSIQTFQGHVNVVRAVAFHPGGAILATGSEDHTIRFWDVQTGHCLRILEGHMHWIRSIAFSPDGTILASASGDHTIRIWATDTGQCVHVLQGHTDIVRTVSFGPGGEMLASGGNDAVIRLWDVKTGSCTRVLYGHRYPIRSVAFSPGGDSLASSSDDQTARIWDVKSERCLNILQGHSNRVWSVAFHPGGAMLATGSEDQTIRIWDVRTGYCLKALQGYKNSIWTLAFSADGAMLASGTDDQLVRVWDMQTGHCLKVFPGHVNRVRSVAFSPDGSCIASASDDQMIRLWDVSTGHCINILQGHTHLVRAVAFSPDGRSLASSSHDETIRIWHIATGSCLRTIRGDSGPIWSLAFSPDGESIVSGSDDQAVRIWDVKSGACRTILHGHTHRIWSVTFHPEGERIASGSDDHTIRIWDVKSGTCVHTLRGHGHWVRSLAFSPNGELLVSGSHDHTIRVWEVATGRCLKTLSGHTNWLWSVAFSPDNRHIASGGDGGIIRVWDVDTGMCIETLVHERPYELMDITGVRGLTVAQKGTLHTLGAVEDST